ncbi:hypothetical protein SpCBS45565_g07279 [Spizellomyces sp. 'palustris']|nr:hypothetical protein SpCBS45565_g07279 [Spizellomyces sp. 'palustris']
MVPVECPVLTENGTTTSMWGPAPTCIESAEEFAIPFALDANYQCSWILDGPFYKFLRNAIEGKAPFMCRVPLSKDKTYYMPLTISLWGALEPAHLHVMNHINFVFHVVDGFFLGGSAYALRDHYVLGAEGGALTTHGPLRWFVGHTFDLHPDGAQQPAEQAQQQQAVVKPATSIPRASEVIKSVERDLVLIWAAITAPLVAGILVILYLRYGKQGIQAKKQK